MISVLLVVPFLRFVEQYLNDVVGHVLVVKTNLVTKSFGGDPVAKLHRRSTKVYVHNLFEHDLWKF